MRRTVAFTVAIVLVSVSLAHAANVGIITGSEKGTYYQFGLNLQALAKQHGFSVNVIPSKGSIENVHAVYERPGTQIGIVQADVLAFVGRLQSDPVLQRIAKKTKMVFPLYNEEVHVLARSGITNFDDLADRRVAVGREGSGTYLTTRLLFNVSEVAPKEMVPIDTDEALGELKAGRIDAMFYVAGVPVKLLHEGVSSADGLTLLPITNKAITEFYPPVEIPANVYPWQEGPVTTVAVKSVLVSFDFRYRDCDTVGKFAKVVSDNMDWLVKHGHPKWRSVDLNYQLKGWDQYDCVRKHVKGAAQRPATTTGKKPDLNPVMQAIKQVLGD
jgi:TRAP transporter TAXI family solute receptor